MRLPRFVGLVDLAVVTLVVVALVLPARARDAAPVVTENAIRDALALAEARAEVSPKDGLALEQYGRLLGTAHLKDWEIEATVRGLDRVGDAPTRWRALLATSVAYVDSLDAKTALDYADKALNACRAAPEACSDSDRIRIEPYVDYLAAGVASGIDPRRDPIGFSEAAQRAIRPVRVKSPLPNR